jgi:hypothetical protein
MLPGSIPGWRVVRNSLAAVALLGLTMCENLDNFNVSAAGKVTIPKATLIDKLLGSVAFSGFDKVDFTEQFKNQDVKEGDVDSVRMQSITLLIEAPAGQTFTFIKSVHLFAQAAGLPKIEIGAIDTVDQSKREIDLIVDDKTDLKPYVVAPSMQITSEVEGSRPDQDVVVAAAVILDVDINVPGCN